MNDRTEIIRLTDKVGEIRALFVEFDHIALIKEDLHDLVSCGTSGAERDVHALIGKTRVGKTKLLQGFMADYQAQDEATGRIVLPNGDWAMPMTICKVGVPDISSRALVETIYQELTGKPVIGRPSRLFLEGEIKRYAQARHLRLLILEESHQADTNPLGRKAAEVAEKIKDIANWSLFSQLIVGTERADSVIKSTPELASRCTVTHYLKPFDWQKEEDRESCVALLNVYDDWLEEAVFGRRSGLDCDPLASALCAAGDGVMGDMATLVVRAGTLAVREMLAGKAKYIEPRHLASAFDTWGAGAGKSNPFAGGRMVEQPLLAVQTIEPVLKRAGGRRAARDRNFRP